MGLPVVGYLPFLTSEPHIKLMKLAKKYGDVFSIYLGSKPVVILNGAEAINEAFNKKEFLGRPPNSAFSVFHFNAPFLTPDFKVWQEQRRFVVQCMRDLGLGKSKTEHQIQEEIHYFLDVLSESRGQPMDLVEPLAPSASNNIFVLVFGERYDYADPIRVKLDNALDTFISALTITANHSFFPWLRKLPFSSKIFNYGEALDDFKKIREYINAQIKKHKDTLNPTDTRDLIDSYLVEMKNRKEKDPNSTLSEELLEGTLISLFSAGSETVRTSVSWCMYTMAAYPEVQRKVRKEILDVLGSRFPQYSDHKLMPYTQAIIREVARWQTIAPLNLLRYTLDESEVKGQYIPKGVSVLANFYSAHHDPVYWKDPEIFRPERFILPDGSLLKTTHFMNFSVGKRSCPGENMAMIEVFLYFVAILQKFEVSFPEGYKPKFEAELGITYRLKPHKLCFKAR